MDWSHPVAPFGPHRYFDFRSFSPFQDIDRKRGGEPDCSHSIRGEEREEGGDRFQQGIDSKGV